MENGLPFSGHFVGLSSNRKLPLQIPIWVHYINSAGILNFPKNEELFLDILDDNM